MSNTDTNVGLKPVHTPGLVSLDFRPGAETPDVPPRNLGGFIIVTRNAEGKHFCFAAYYLNGYPLEYEDGDCRCSSPEVHEQADGCPTTGWFYDESNWEYENCYHKVRAEIVAWASIPKASDVLEVLKATGGAL